MHKKEWILLSTMSFIMMMSITVIIIELLSPTSPNTQESPEKMNETLEIQEDPQKSDSIGEKTQGKEGQYNIKKEESINDEPSKSDQSTQIELQNNNKDSVEEEKTINDETRVNEVIEQLESERELDQPLEDFVTPNTPESPTIPIFKSDREE